jgi:hypothetical protein
MNNTTKIGHARRCYQKENDGHENTTHNEWCFFRVNPYPSNTRILTKK